ncbi:MAG: outer membrane beta-barrel protein [Bacteroidota bacterium]
MKKIIFILFLSLFTQNCSYAQRFGIKFAWSKAALKLDNFAQDNTQLYQGYQIGIYARSDSRIYLQPEAYYQKKDGLFANLPGMTNYIPTTRIYKQSVTLHTLNIPLVVGINAIKKKKFTLHGFGGVQACVVVGNSISSDYSFTPITKNNIENISVKYFYGGGIDLYFLSFDVRYYIDATDAITSATDISFPSLKNYYTFNIGLKLLK